MRCGKPEETDVTASTLHASLRIAGSGIRTYLPPVLSWLALWTLSFVLMHLYVGKIALDEAVFAAIGSAITATASVVVLEKHLAPLRAEWRAIAQVFRIPRYVVTGTWDICLVLWRQIVLRKPADSLIYGVPFDAGGDDDQAAFRRALAVAWTTATPNFVILGFDRPRGLLVYHQVRKSAIPEMTKRLGARP